MWTNEQFQEVEEPVEYTQPDIEEEEEGEAFLGNKFW